MRAVALVKVGDLQDRKLRNRAALDRLIYCIAHIAFLSQKTIELDDGSGPCSQNVSDDNLEFPGKFSRFLFRKRGTLLGGKKPFQQLGDVLPMIAERGDGVHHPRNFVVS